MNPDVEVFLLLSDEKDFQVWKKQDDLLLAEKSSKDSEIREISTYLFNRVRKLSDCLAVLGKISPEQSLILATIVGHKKELHAVIGNIQIPKVSKQTVEEVCARGLTRERSRTVAILVMYQDCYNYLPSAALQKCDIPEMSIKKLPIDKLYRVRLEETKRNYSIYYCGYCGLVGFFYQQCSRCKKVHYCSPKHQQNDWNVHKQVCKSPASGE